MPIQEFALDATGTRRVLISREAGPLGDQLHVLLDRSMLGTISGQEAESAGREFALPDGSFLKVQLAYSQVQVLWNGQPLPSISAATRSKSQLALPRKTLGRFWVSCGVVFLIGAVNVLLGIILASTPGQPSAQQILPLTLLIAGGLYLLLGFFVARKSSVALGIAVTLYALDGLIALFQGSLGGIPLHIILLIFMARGFSAIREIRDAKVAAQLY